jgi:hypothetical protein
MKHILVMIAAVAFCFCLPMIEVEDGPPIPEKPRMGNVGGVLGDDNGRR